METKATPYSNLKIFHHAELLQKLKSGERVAPIYVRIKPTNICNENCYYCHYKNSYLQLGNYRPNDMIPREKMLEIVDDLAEIGTKAVTFSGGGEPTVYPYINETLHRVIDKGLDFAIITNGTRLHGETAQLLAHAKWARLSIDSSNAKLYSETRGVNENLFDILCHNIEEFAKIKEQQCELGVNYVVSDRNHGDVLEMSRLMKSLGVNHVKFAPVMSNESEKYHAPFKAQVMVDLEKAKELEDNNFRIIDLYTSDIKRWESGIVAFDRAYTQCWMKELHCIVAADQRIYYCQDKAYLPNGVVGDLHERRFKDVWFSPETTRLFREFNAHNTCAEHCVHDDRNIMLNQFFSVDENHVNFL